MSPSISPRRNLDILLSDASRDLVTAVLETGSTSARLGKVTPAGVTVRPSGDVLVRYTVELVWADATSTQETLVAATGTLIPDGAAVIAGDLEGESIEVGLWRWPQDPALPALTHVAEHDRLRALLSHAGITPTEPLSVRLQSYRPAKRAVFAVTAGPHRLFAKVVPPVTLPGIRTRHELLSAHVPVPQLLASHDDGLVLMPALAGTPGRAALQQGQRMSDAVALEELLERLPTGLTELPGRSDYRSRARHYTAVLGLTAITEDAELHELTVFADAIADAASGDQPVEPVHGDFYENQLLVDSSGTVTGLLDIDTAGPGHRIDDWATLLAHLTVLDTPAARSWGRDILRHAESRFDPRHLRPRVASTVLGLATGPFRTQQANWPERTQQRIALARQWFKPS